MNTIITESKRSRLGFGEFVALMATMTSLAALSTDAMLPALPAIGLDLGLQQENAGQLVVSTLFLGMAVGQLFYGPVSDSSGRKPAIYVGFLLFIAGCLLSMVSGSFTIMLAGRLLQGIGVAGPRSVTTALIRDLYEGRRMAQVMSFIATVFILVPIIAPMLGQGVLMIAGWRAIFGALLLLAALTVIWFAARQPETLPVDRRVPFSIGRILRVFGEVLANPSALGYTVTAGLASGAFMGYLNSAQQIFQDQYGVGARFPFYFATLALALGTASFVNARLVIRFGMRALSWTALIGLSTLSILFFIFAFTQDGNPALWVLHGLHDGRILLHRYPLRQPQLVGHGAVGPHRRCRRGRGRLTLVDHRRPAGRVHRPAIQRHDPAAGGRIWAVGTSLSGHHGVGQTVLGKGIGNVYPLRASTSSL